MPKSVNLFWIYKLLRVVAIRCLFALYLLVLFTGIYIHAFAPRSTVVLRWTKIFAVAVVTSCTDRLRELPKAMKPENYDYGCPSVCPWTTTAVILERFFAEVVKPPTRDATDSVSGGGDSDDDKINPLRTQSTCLCRHAARALHACPTEPWSPV